MSARGARGRARVVRHDPGEAVSEPGHKPFRMKVRLLNNRLVRAREEMGLSQTAAAKAIGITNSLLSAYENFGVRNNNRTMGLAWGERGWVPSALRIADFYGLSPEYLWPEEVASVRKAAMMLELSATDVRVFADADMDAREMVARVREAKALLSPGDVAILEARFVDDRTLDELGQARLERLGETVGHSRERMRVMVQSASARLRQALKRLDARDQDRADHPRRSTG